MASTAGPRPALDLGLRKKIMKRSLDSDAPRTTSTGSSSTPSFPALGEDASIWLPEHSLTLRYGTSLRLMASCSAFLNDSEEFAEVNPEDDWQKWANRVPGAFSLFYAAILDPLKPEGGGGVLCVLRAVLDNWPTPTAPHNARLIIDYCATKIAARGQGFASRLVRHVKEAASNLGANCYVLALEESCVYWMEKGFVLEEGKNLNARLNLFPDTWLLRTATDPPDEGSPDDLALAVEEEGGEEEEEAGEQPSPIGEADEEADPDLAAALALSMAPTVEPTAAPSPLEAAEQGAAAAAKEEIVIDDGGEEDDEDLQAALALSLS